MMTHLYPGFLYQMWLAHTRIGPKRTKSHNPTVRWIFSDKRQPNDHHLASRQVSQNGKTSSSCPRLLCLGVPSIDIVPKSSGGIV